MTVYDVLEIFIKIVFAFAPVVVVVLFVRKFFKPKGPKISKEDELVANEIRINDPGFDIISFKESAASCIKEVFNCFYIQICP